MGIHDTDHQTRAQLMPGRPPATAWREAPKGPSILVVDDSPTKRLVLTEMLAPLGHTVVAVDSGRVALRAVMRETFAMILMDVLMPGMDGYQTARLIRQHGKSDLTPIIFVSAYRRDEIEIATA